MNQRNLNMCEACINCSKSWSANSDLSCHDCCDLFKEWKEYVKKNKKEEGKAE